MPPTAGTIAALALAALVLWTGNHDARAAAPVDYADPAHWLCRPGALGPCAATLTATVFPADGTPSKVSYAPAPDPPIDCFYVYPTVSREPTPNADLAVGEEEKHVAEQQLGRFAADCRTFAPVYRQITVAGLKSAYGGDAAGVDFEQPYGDVLAAWNYYLQHDNHGRGFVLIAHSQGTHLLLRLLASEIDGKPSAARLVSAIIPGGEIDVPEGQRVGGSLKHIPLCAAATDTGCVIGYSSYLATLPPGENAHFSHSDTPGMVDACVNPAALTDDGVLRADLPAVGPIGGSFGTDFLENPGVLKAKCVSAAGHSYLAISLGTDVRGSMVGAGLARLDARLPGWGLHALDINLALGNLVDLVGRQAAAWQAQHPPALP